MGGFVASAYMRGVRYLCLGTTLIAQVDAGIGGKLAVNHPTAKNLIGSFHQPLGVISDVSFLRTLDRRQLRAGLAECIKKAIIASPAYWELIERERGGDPRGRRRRARGARSRRGRDQGRADRARPVRAGLAAHARLRPRARAPARDGHLVHRAPARRGGGVRDGGGGADRRGARPAGARAARADARPAPAGGPADHGPGAAHGGRPRAPARCDRADPADPRRRLSLRSADRPRRDGDRRRRDARRAPRRAPPLRHRA